MTLFYTQFADLLLDLNEWGPIFTLWSNSEESLHKALTAVAVVVGKNYMALQSLVRIHVNFC